ncbi:MAG: hypothetical protein JKY89_13480 [Immundisolibacteraceae bacterium]|nr:hypothetical protein [Immundisolibacteraceae bacterium]
MQPEYRISRTNKSAARWLKLVLFVALLLIGMLLYRLGGEHRAGNYAELVQNFSVVEQELNRLAERSIALSRENAGLHQQHELDLLAQQNIAKELRLVRGQFTGLRKELELYTRLADRSVEDVGIFVHRFEVFTTENLGEYRYHLLLAQPLTADDQVSGKVELMVGTGEAAQQVGLHEFKFQVYGSYEGLISPLTSDPDLVVKVSVVNGVDSIKQYSWRELLDGEQGNEEEK